MGRARQVLRLVDVFSEQSAHSNSVEIHRKSKKGDLFCSKHSFSECRVEINDQGEIPLTMKYSNVNLEINE